MSRMFEHVVNELKIQSRLAARHGILMRKRFDSLLNFFLLFIEALTYSTHLFRKKYK